FGSAMIERTRIGFEFLVDSSAIARRVIRVPGRASGQGAMLLGIMALELHDGFVVGAAPAAVAARALLRAAGRGLAAGANPALLTGSIRLAVDAAQASPAAQARPVAQLDELVALATSVTGDPELGAVLGEMFEVMGEHATVITQDAPRPCLDHEY